ncbi:ABC transporter ATP-binding protein [Paenibacillus sp. YYML68]|uniref:ABC transporter ATP-binding protein n=1 Tax=Paenibacillus sp. YYML68 TaxID=2909250 RepID=UPI002490F62F|nr:ABC transporter ATP-binding protein [Paenibacillus sp. YYML68]
MHAVKVTGVSKAFKGELIFDSIDLELEAGLIHGIIGHNGSGKSVLFKLLCGMIVPDQGSVQILNHTLGKEIDYPEHTGAVIEQPGFLSDRSGLDNLTYLAAIRNKITPERIKQALQAVGLNPNDKKKVKAYSIGMKQRLAIAQAIMEEPKLLLLDEPMNGLDKSGVAQIRQLIMELKQQGVTIVLSSHIAEDIRLLCDRVYEIDNKRVTLVSQTATEV